MAEAMEMRAYDEDDISIVFDPLYGKDRIVAELKPVRVELSRRFKEVHSILRKYKWNSIDRENEKALAVSALG